VFFLPQLAKAFFARLIMQQQTAPRKRSNWPFPAYPEPSSPKSGKQFKGASRTRNMPAVGLAGNGTATSPAWGGVSSGFGGARGRSGLGGPSRLGMLADICMVLVWGGSIPAVMWLGSAVGL
jgi:hypothetical protein